MAGVVSANGVQQQQEQHRRQRQQQHLVAAVEESLQSLAGQVGLVHLALHPAGDSLVGGWRSQVFAVVEPSPEADRLAAEWSALVARSSGQVSSGGGGDGSAGLAQLLAGRACLEFGDGQLLTVLSQQRVRTPQGRLVTSWMFQLAAPAPGALLGTQVLLPLVAHMPRLVVVSSSGLPRALVGALLRVGARAVVAAAEEAGSDAQDGAAWSTEEVEGFFSELYRMLIVTGATVPEALAAAEGAWPRLHGAFACYHL